ncbi:MAG: hypothetical protein WEE89_20225 [Gemmatimonadota bacterium]
MVKPRVVLPAVLLLFAACETDPPNTVTASVRDSAGVQLVTNTAPLWNAGDQWRLSAEPTLDIGTTAGAPEYELAGAHGPVRLSDGRIAVANGQTDEIRFYDAAGNYIRSAGRSGEGPGEFSQLYRLRKFAGDSLLALNPISTTSIFTADGQYIRRFDLDPVPRRMNIWWTGWLSDGTLLAFSLVREGTRERPGDDHGHIIVPPKPPGYRDSLMHFLYDMQGRLIDSIGKLPGQFLGEDRLVFVPNAAYAFHQDAFYHSPGDIIEIRRYKSLARERTAGDTSKGAVMRLERIVRLSTQELGVTDSMKQIFTRRRQARNESLKKTNPTIGPMLERELAETKFPETIPAHGQRMLADALGNIWLQNYSIDSDQPESWKVFDASGQWLGTVQMPERFSVNEIGADYVLGIGSDEFDVQHVRMYRLEKPAERTGR